MKRSGDGEVETGRRIMAESTEQQKIDLVRALAAYGASGVSWYVVIDAAQDATAIKRAAESGVVVQSLYEGQLGAELSSVAPHLAAIDLKSEFTKWFTENWSRNCGIIIQSAAPHADVRRHLRKFLTVKDEAGKQYRFRFYDPRVMRAFLPACVPEEVAEFFGPIVRYYAISRNGRTVECYSTSPRGLATRVIPPGRM